ncbi:MAG: Asp-tRNA(Asn)/Glu-tRNA(Gln) amidotransferase subunit GatC [Saprospiraceae bacterium]|nr:Asp-tRNA(Asn)/Glu-tRNA(Gln) amidotransferase subunit GatC [Saprospiraceae bacterium]
MKIDRDVILKLEKLAKLQLQDHERAELLNDLNAMLKMIGKLDELNVDDLPPLRHITDAVNQLREDQPAAPMNAEDALKNATSQDGTYFKVPKIIE